MRMFGRTAQVFAVFVSGCAVSVQAQVDPPRQHIVSPTGVNYFDSAFRAKYTDLSVGPLSLERMYSSKPANSRTGVMEIFGYGWSHNFDIKIEFGTWNFDSQTNVIIGGEFYGFWGYPSSTPSTPRMDETGFSLIREGGIDIFTDRHGVKYRFASNSSSNNFPVQSITYPSGEILSFSYVSGKLKLVTNNRGYAIIFDVGSNGKISSACGFNLSASYVSTGTVCSSAALKTSYTYSGINLTGSTDVIGYTSHYSYAGGYLSCPTDPNSFTCKVTNEYNATSTPDTIGSVVKQTLANGDIWQYYCSCGGNATNDPDNLNSTEDASFTDPSGHGMAFRYSHERSLSEYYDQNLRHFYLGFYGRLLTGGTYPEGNTVTPDYNGRGVPSGSRISAKPGSGLAPIVLESQTFPATCANTATCNLPTSVTDANGNVTSFTYDSTHGGVLTRTSPADAAGLQAVVRYAYQLRSAGIKNSGGGYSAMANGIWLLSEERTCRTSATIGNACAGGASDEVVRTYDYGPTSGPNNLLLRGVAVTADGVTLRTCYGYDWQGNKISETTPRAVAGTCS
jgi:YD repeat-containing protein